MASYLVPRAGRSTRPATPRHQRHRWSHGHRAPAEALAITAIASDSGTVGDFITSDTTLIVSGSNGALAAGEKIQVSSDGGQSGPMSRRRQHDWSYDDTATVHASSFTYQARIVDTAGNIGTTASQAITIANLPAEAVAITAIAS